jgi:protein-S-isoprenylcysteine O-methyltransferase Ste14
MSEGPAKVSSPADLHGATDLLVALGWQATRSRFAIFNAIVALLMLGLLAVTVVLGDILELPAPIFQVVLWAGWLTWLGYLLPWRRERSRNASGVAAYRRAFWRELILGIAFNFAMLLRPAAVGLSAGGAFSSPWLLIIGAVATAGGGFVLFGAARQLGVSCAFFVYEYSEAPVVLVEDGIYGRLRHPLFAGGICMSVGLGLCVGTSVALELALVNALVLPVYGVVEDQRCRRAVGHAYAEYGEAVGGVFPRRG